MIGQTFFLNAFSSATAKGNPAAVVPLTKWISENEMQRIAAKNNVAETAFFVKAGDDFALRWFTPTVEVDLCGHATLAASYVIFKYLEFSENLIQFSTKSGILNVARSNDLLTLDFPGRIVESCAPTDKLLACFDETPVDVLKSGTGTYIVVLSSQRQIEEYRPDFSKLAQVDRCVNITALGNDCDFVSRFFGPNLGLGEDPVTGSAHCGLAIYWARQLNRKDRLHAWQLSPRGGELFCEIKKDRVLISGGVTESDNLV